MKKKVVRKHSRIKHSTNNTSLSLFVGVFTVIIFIVIVSMVGSNLMNPSGKIRVLGASTGPTLLARGGDDPTSGQSVPPPPSNSGSNTNSGGQSGEGSAHNDSTSSTNNTGNTNSGSNDFHSPSGGPSSTSSSQQVDCIGPDGRHFTVSLSSCQEFNTHWQNAHFSFIPLGNGSPTMPQSLIQPTASKEAMLHRSNNERHGTPLPPISGVPQNLDVHTDNNQSSINLASNGTQVEIKNEGHRLMFSAKKADGTEVKLNKDDAMKILNATLKDNGVQLGENENNVGTITKDGVEATSQLPLSVNPTTHEVTLTTSTGAKAISVLPDEAVKNLLVTKTFTSVESQIATDSSAVTQKTTLTEINNEPVFVVNGVSQKKIFGLLPVGFAKTAFVSAATGLIVKTDETIMNKILETFSF